MNSGDQLPDRAVAGADARHGARRLWVRTFRTRQAADAADLIRTFGTVVRAPSGPLSFPEHEARRHAHPAPPPNCARGKVVAFCRNGGWCEAACYQLSDCRTRARVVACCNATAAAAASCAGGGRVTMRVALPGDRVVGVDARVRPTRAARCHVVQQTWSDVAFAVRDEGRADGRRCAVCVTALNNYLVVETGPGEEAAAFPVCEALGLARRFGIACEPLLARVAVVQAAGGAPPAVKFFTCGEREHPSAPLSGLAVLAVAARRLGWPSLPAGRAVVTPAGPMALPAVDVFSDETARVEFPGVVVSLGRDPAVPLPGDAA